MLVAIDDLTIYRGRRYARRAREALDWAAANSDMLMQEWTRLNA